MDAQAGALVIAPEVITTVVRMTALATPGVARLCTTVTGRMSRVFRGARSVPGIDVNLQEGLVTVDLYIVAARDVQFLQLGERLQTDISRAISKIVGLPIQAVNIHIEDVDDPFNPEQGAAGQDFRN